MASDEDSPPLHELASSLNISAGAEQPIMTETEISFLEFFKQQEFGDLTIRFSETEISAHRFAVSRKSSWFRKACSGDFKEAQDAVIELHEDDASAVRAMMLFIYDKPYTGACENEDDDLLFYVRVFMVADKYDLGDLKSLVCVDFNKIAPGLWDDDVFCEAVKEGYDLPAHGGYSAMNTIIEQICIRHLSTLTKKPTFMEACLSVPELTCKLLKVSSDNLERGLHTDKDRVSKLKECDERVRGLDLTISEKETKIKGLKAAVQSSKMPVEVAVECPKSRCQALISKCYWKLHRSRKQWKYRMPCPQCNAWLHESDEMGDLIYFYP